MIYVSFDIGVKNLALCIINQTDDEINIIDWKIIALAQSISEAKNINETAEKLYIELDNIIGQLNDMGFSKIDFVLIEDQPSNLNRLMKKIQYLIFSYFNLLKHWDNAVSQVILVNPSLKLQTHSIIPPSRKDKTIKYTRREKYINNKKDSVEICKYYIKDNEKLSTFFTSNKKLDDYADTLLQTVSYIRKKGNKIESVSIDDKNIMTL
jgi:hypothetical protein